MNNEDRDTRFLAHVRSELDREVENLDVDTAARLRRIRYSALEQHESQRVNWWRLFRFSAVAVATGMIIAVVMTTNFRSSSTSHDEQTLADLEILTSSEQLNLFADFEFYFWLTEKEDHAG
ncbi:MAG: hypothetical protein JJV98_13540 [Desulfosarcina sp.]|nr:hypothetical protein [Desulfobacterales bacterium]